MPLIHTTFFLIVLLNGWATPAFGQNASAPLPLRTYTLPELLNLVMDRNPLLQEHEGILDQREGQQLSASAYPNPTLSFHGAHGTIRDPSNGISITERYVTLSQPLEWPGKRSANQRAAQAGAESAVASLEEAKLDLMALTKHAFFDLLLARHQADTTAKNLQTMKEVRDAVLRRVESGEAPPFEAIKVRVETLQAQKELSQAEGLVTSFQATLNSLTAGALGADFQIQGEFIPWPGDLSVQSLSDKALTRHPLLIKWQKLIEEAQQAHSREEQARIPNVTISGSYQRDAGREAYVGALSVPFPIWDQRQGDIAQAKGILREREARFLRTKHELLKGIAQQVQLSQVASEQISTYERGLLKQAQEALRIAQVSFRFGESSLLDVLDAQRVLRQTQVNYAQAQYDLSIALTELERLTGSRLHP